MRRQISNYRVDVFRTKPTIGETTNTKADPKQGKGKRQGGDAIT